jgi:hypothetical protein
MAKPKVLTPAPGSRIVKDGAEVILFAQPPEVLKGLLRIGISNFDTLVLTDVREKDGSLLNNLEFPFFHVGRGRRHRQPKGHGPRDYPCDDWSNNPKIFHTRLPFHYYDG